MTDNLGSLASLHRYPVKSMMGEGLNAARVTLRGLFGDRSYALCDTQTGKVVSAKNPRKWPNMFSYHAAYTSPPPDASNLPPVHTTLPHASFTVNPAPRSPPSLSPSH